MAEPQDGPVLDCHEQDAGLGGALVPRRRHPPVHFAEPLHDEGVSGILDAGRQHKVGVGREAEGHHSGNMPCRAAHGVAERGPSAMIVGGEGASGAPADEG